MWATNQRSCARRALLKRQSGTAAVEFALLAIIFFTFIFGIIEIARIMFVYNTLHEVTRRAAAAATTVYPDNPTALDTVRQMAIFRNAPGEIILGAPVTDQHVRIDYLALTRNPAGALALAPIPNGLWAASAALNRQICMSNPNAPDCIRFVRARICEPGLDECRAVQSQMLVPLVALRVPLPRGETITAAESLGYTQGMIP